ncbi:MAG: LPS-assembly protein LptD [Devosia sp.]
MSSLRRIAVGIAAVGLVLLAGAPPASAQLLPEGFFDQIPATGGQAQIEADMLAYDGQLDVISAEGDVVMSYEGYQLTGDKLSYNQTTGELDFIGNVVIRDPAGTVFRADRVRVTGGMKEAFLESLTLTTPDGSLIKAKDVNYSRELETILTQAHYSPCGLCIDSKGRRIGWKVNASKIVYNRDEGWVYLEGAGLEILGIPVAWIPWLVLPDPTQPRRQGFRMPSVDYNQQYGGRLDLPYFVPVSETMDLLLTPTLFTRQGFLMAAEWAQRFEYGDYDIKASGIYQLDPAAYAGTVGNTAWRGAIQTSGRFVPFEDWKAGWSYTAFSDAAYLVDYKLQSSKNVVNEVYATHLSEDFYLDVRVQQFNLLGNVTPPQQQQHARAVPSIRAAHYLDLGDMGQVAFEARVLGIQRGADSTATYNGVPYIFAYQENKVHATIEASWQNQYILPAGIVATPYLGLRGDAAYYDGSSPLLAGPISLFEATPIAAMDFRWPLIAVNGHDTHLFEPIVQVVYRGSGATLPGITNDDAQSFVFDDTNLFSYNRFSGTDRQETGLRMNIGGRYLANFEDGSWLQLTGGQSYQLAGLNALGVADTAQTGTSTGLGGTASYLVLGAQGSPFEGVTLGAKAQLDPAGFSIRRAGVAAQFSFDGRSVGGDYVFIPADAAIGTATDQQEITGWFTTPLPIDYWYANASVSWDIAANAWLQASGGLTYDDGYFVTSVYGAINGPTHSSPNAQSFGFKFKLRGPAGEFSF